MDAESTKADREGALPETLGVRSLTEVFRKHPERRYVMFGGKGGLGKTTFSAATAFWLAQQGHRVLVFSVDPQASLSDIFERDIFGQGPVKIIDNLWAQEIDADKHIADYQDEIRRKILDMYGLDKVPDEIEDYIQAASAEPAMEESAIFDSVIDIVVSGDYDYYIYDLVPLGHALYYLSMAKVYDEWITKITHLREEMREYEEVVAKIRREKEVQEDQILGELQYIRDRINTASRILADRDRTAFFFVVIPEELAHADGAPAFLANRVKMQRRYLDEIRSTLGDEILARVPELERDVTGLEMIERTARILFREE